jgi:TRAP-type uncharacterized transport system substrate-binding protein
MSKDKTSSDTGTPAPPGKHGFLARVTEIFGIGPGVTIAGIIAICLVLGIAVFLFMKSALPSTIVITTGPEGSVFHTNALRYADFLGHQSNVNVKLKVLTSAGSLENLKRLSDPSFPVDLGFVQGGVSNAGMDKLVSLGSVSYQPLLIFYRGEPIELLSSLAAKQIAIGPVGSGTRALALLLLETNGIKPGGDTKLLDWEPRQSSKGLLDGKIDAAFLMGEDASPAIMRQLLRAEDIHLYSFKQAAAYTRRFPYLSVLELPEGSLDFGKDLPPQNIFLLGPTVELISRKHFDPALVDLLLDAAREVHGRATILQKKGEFPAPLEHDFKISPEAMRYYKSGKSFFYRFLPFWMASLARRIILVFVPAVVVLVPLLRSIPPFYKWRVRSRIFRWYRALLAVERDLLKNSGEHKREQLLRRLDEIEDAANRMKVPTSFADQFYGLRTNIDFVRNMINERHGAAKSG